MNSVESSQCGASPHTTALAHAFACARNDTTTLPLVESATAGGCGVSDSTVVEDPLARRRGH
jgi:hypothetical protein